MRPQTSRQASRDGVRCCGGAPPPITPWDVAITVLLLAVGAAIVAGVAITERGLDSGIATTALSERSLLDSYPQRRGKPR